MTLGDFKTILVAIDGSPESAAGLEKAIRQAAIEGASNLHLVGVLDPPFIDMGRLGLSRSLRSTRAKRPISPTTSNERRRAFALPVSGLSRSFSGVRPRQDRLNAFRGTRDELRRRLEAFFASKEEGDHS